jgi:hypothetical protein
MGCTLFAHTVGFFGIVYFDQSVMPWYLLLALFSSCSEFFLQRAERPAPWPAGEPALAANGRVAI